MRFLEEASRLGRLRAALWDDGTIESVTGRPARFPLEERRYVLEAVSYVSKVSVISSPFEPEALPEIGGPPADCWAVPETEDTAAKRAFCRDHGLGYRVISANGVSKIPPAPHEIVVHPGRKRVIVTGCYDWLHSGHVRFFEEVSKLGDLYVAVGHDANVRMLKGPGHPLFAEEIRRYMASSIRYVTQALVTSGTGWLDAEPEIARIRPHVYAVNEDGDKPEKRAFCDANHIEYVVLHRAPKDGLPRRASTDLRGF
jgi:cytidyltransferase-like protein